MKDKLSNLIYDRDYILLVESKRVIISKLESKLYKYFSFHMYHNDNKYNINTLDEYFTYVLFEYIYRWNKLADLAITDIIYSLVDKYETDKMED